MKTRGPPVMMMITPHNLFSPSIRNGKDSFQKDIEGKIYKMKRA